MEDRGARSPGYPRLLLSMIWGLVILAAVEVKEV